MKIPSIVTKTFGTSLLQIRKFSPEILTAVGVVGVVVAGVMASRATLKLEDVIDESQLRLKVTRQRDSVSDYYENSLSKAYLKNTMSLVKLYAPAVTLGAASIICIVSANGIMRKRNIALAVAYKGLEQAYSNYRERVVDEYGEEVDRKLYLGLCEEDVTDPETGKTIKKQILDPKKSGNPYVFEFTPQNPNWSNHGENNLFFLHCHQTVFNNILRGRGHVFLNEVLEALGFDHTPAGAVTGWLLRGNGDGAVDFHIDEGDYQRRTDDGSGRLEGYVLLNFNVDGTIYDKI